MKRPAGASTIWAAMALMTAMPALLGSVSPAFAQASHAIPRRGDYLPQDVIQAGPHVDYAAAHLRKPPAGYGWYQLGHTYVMAAVATGLIVEVVVL